MMLFGPPSSARHPGQGSDSDREPGSIPEGIGCARPVLRNHGWPCNGMDPGSALRYVSLVRDDDSGGVRRPLP